MSVNKVILIGNVGKDPDIRYPQQGQCVASFSLATTEKFTSNGQLTERTEWHNIVVWGKQAETVEKYVRKGTKLYIEGKLRTRQWEDRNAIKRYVTEVYVDTFELLGSRPANPQAPQAPQSPTNAPF
ncbi:MAG: single-stranded DNA-binding protein [Bacteroidales bacterium]|nr:single-stranded DNA-binding protein [Bacteroidales bacterium]